MWWMSLEKLKTGFMFKRSFVKVLKWSEMWKWTLLNGDFWFHDSNHVISVIWIMRNKFQGNELWFKSCISTDSNKSSQP